MATRRLYLALPVCLFLPTLLLAEETAVKSRIVSVGLFKNGLAVVKRQVTVPGSGTHRFDDVPTPIHGTYWVESDANIETSVKMREVEAPLSQATGTNLQEELAGKRVVIHLRECKASPVSGTVARLERAHGRAENSPREGSRFLILDLGSRRVYVDLSQIVSLEAEDTGNRVKQRRPQLVVLVEKADKKPVTVAITYLARGLSWAPSYRIDITDPKVLSLEQAAVIKNELTDLEGAEVGLISGFPSIQYANVTSPFSTRTTWASFFQELSQRSGRLLPIETSNLLVTQQVLPESAGLDLSATPTGEGVDLHYQSIGRRTLAEGDTLALTVARGQASYERIVEWLVPDNRDADGRLTGRQRGDGDSYEDVPWDALRFRNPLSFPMTTAPALVVSGGRFNGQRLSTWANAGEETNIHVTQALSIRTRNLEQESLNKGDEGRQVVFIGGRRFRKTNVVAELIVSNHRKEGVKMVIRRRFSGELTKAEGSPKTVLREEGVYSVNRRNELIWTFPLKPGEEKKLTYHYSVLVSFSDSDSVPPSPPPPPAP
jgi:hypothetical protein